MPTPRPALAAGCGPPWRSRRAFSDDGGPCPGGRPGSHSSMLRQMNTISDIQQGRASPAGVAHPTSLPRALYTEAVPAGGTGSPGASSPAATVFHGVHDGPHSTALLSDDDHCG